MKEMLIAIFIQIVFLLNFAFSHKTAHGSMPTNTGPDPAPHCGCEGGTSLPFPLWHRTFQMFLRPPRLATANFHSHPISPATEILIMSLKSAPQTDSLLVCHGSHTTADPQCSSSGPKVPPAGLWICSALQDLLCHCLPFGQDGWWQRKCCT